jgi:hypothetical protein
MARFLTSRIVAVLELVVIIVAATAAAGQGLVNVQKLSAALANGLVGEAVARSNSIERHSAVGPKSVHDGPRNAGDLIGAGTSDSDFSVDVLRCQD